LLELDGTRKASYSSYPVPLWLPRTHVRRGRPFPVWAMRRDTANGQPQQGMIQFAGLHGRHYKRLKTVTTTDPRGYLETKVAVKRSGSVRMAWHNATGGPTYSRPVAVSVR
jgi:hypothetical protein